MKKSAWNGIMRAIRHALAPVIAMATASGYITGEQGATIENALITLASIVFAVLWSLALKQFPVLGFLGR